MTKLRIAVFLTVITILIISGCAKKNAESPKSDVEPVQQGNSIPSCKCHSKNPKLVKMHKPFTPMDCSSCHKANPMKNKNETKRLVRLKYKDKLCTSCHKSPKKILAKSRNGMMYCYISKKFYPKGTKICPEHKDKLIDLDLLIKTASSKKPTKQVCLACHEANNKLVLSHKERKKVVTKSTDCLKCHKSHLKCDGCHD